MLEAIGIIALALIGLVVAAFAALWGLAKMNGMP